MSVTIRFEDYKSKIIAALDEKNIRETLPQNEEYAILEGFLDSPFSYKVSPEFQYEINMTIPAICIIGQSTGRMHLFSLVTLLPELSEENLLGRS